jgi:hypothetical protein
VIWFVKAIGCLSSNGLLSPCERPQLRRKLRDALRDRVARDAEAVEQLGARPRARQLAYAESVDWRDPAAVAATASPRPPSIA